MVSSTIPQGCQSFSRTATSWYGWWYHSSMGWPQPQPSTLTSTQQILTWKPQSTTAMWQLVVLPFIFFFFVVFKIETVEMSINEIQPKFSLSVPGCSEITKKPLEVSKGELSPCWASVFQPLHGHDAISEQSTGRCRYGTSWSAIPYNLYRYPWQSTCKQHLLQKYTYLHIHIQQHVKPLRQQIIVFLETEKK